MQRLNQWCQTRGPPANHRNWLAHEGLVEMEVHDLVMILQKVALTTLVYTVSARVLHESSVV